MWKVDGVHISMTEGDYGIELPINVSGTTISATESALWTVKNKKNGTTVLTKTITNITQNRIVITLTEEESALLVAGVYVYSLDWYKDGVFLCNIIPDATFRVVDKA